jgi:hypothetical protein
MNVYAANVGNISIVMPSKADISSHFFNMYFFNMY